MDTLGVGFLGAGAVVQAIHLPTLARLASRFHVARVMDPDPEVTRVVAERAGARAATEDELFADPEVDVIAVCSPHRFHARQIIAACEAGKRAVLCEKPLAMTVEEARSIADASRRTGVPLVVGSMHLYDPAVEAARDRFAALRGTAEHIHSRIVLPLNERFENAAAADIVRPPAAPAPAVDAPTRIRQLLLGLAIHDLPLVRALLDDWADVEIEHAQLLSPVGFLVVARTPRTVLVLEGGMRSAWRPEWSLEAIAEGRTTRVDFTPSYVHAGSGILSVGEPGSMTTHERAPENGYVGEWMRVAELAQHPTFEHLDDLVDDLSFALDLADKAAAVIAR